MAPLSETDAYNEKSKAPNQIGWGFGSDSWKSKLSKSKKMKLG
jgi:hypothetical protein